MSYCVREGKDKVIFANEEYLSQPSSAVLLPDDSDSIDTSNAGAILPNGEINWDCPCLGNLPNGPCGMSFRDAFSCWVENKDNEEGFAENCFEHFTTWEKCLGEHRHIYKQGNDEPSNDAPSQTITENSNLTLNNEHTFDENVSAINEKSQSVNTSDTRAIAAASTANKT